MDVVTTVLSAGVESPFEAYSTESLLRGGTALVIGGVGLLLSLPLRSVFDASPRFTLIFAASVGLATWGSLSSSPALLELLRMIVALTAILIPALATSIAIRGLIGGT